MTSTATATAPTRRTQAERRARTRHLLLDATLDCLAERGYGATTTTLVSERAGVSRGAQLHHFPTRAELVAAAVEHLFAELTSDYRAAFAELPPDESRLRAAIALLWSMYQKPRWPAALELDTAARTDPDLHAQLVSVSQAHRRNISELAARYFPELADDQERFEDLLTVILDTMYGMAVRRLLHGDEARIEQVLATLGDAAMALLETSADTRV